MRAFGISALCAASLSAALAAESPTPIASQASRMLFTLRTPISVREIPNSDQVEVDLSKADLELKLWKVFDTYNFEAIIDAQGANQAILPTDDHGRLLPEAKVLNERPFIRFYAPGRDAETIDVQCNKKTCRALWKKAPYDALKEQSFQIETNIRGLTGRKWTAGYNQLHIKGNTTFEFPKEKNSPSRTSYFNLETFYWPEDARNTLARGDARVRALEDWNYAEGDDAGVLRFKRIDRVTRFAVIEGHFRVDVANNDYLERREISSGDVLWLFPGQIVSVTNYGPPYEKARVIRIEFERK